MEAPARVAQQTFHQPTNQPEREWRDGGKGSGGGDGRPGRSVMVGEREGANGAEREGR